jgi:hypothetical protein
MPDWSVNFVTGSGFANVSGKDLLTTAKDFRPIGMRQIRAWFYN